MRFWRLLTMMALIPTLALIGACDSDDGTTPGETDTTAPLVVQVSPTQNETDVPVGEAVVVTFSEDMDQDTADDNITLSSGTITGLNWTDATTLTIGHTAWSEGAEITATIGTGLADAAGNTLAEAFTWGFWTYTDDVRLLGSIPADGAVDVTLNSQIRLFFSEGMNSSTLPGAITISSPDKADLAYTLDGEDEEWILVPDADLPADTEITVTVGTGAQNYYGESLAEETSFSFTTGDDVDTTPPNLIGIEPVDGSTIPTDTAYLRLTFDEAIDDDSLDPSLVSGQLMLAMDTRDEPGVWSEGNTVYTIGLDTPLVPGAVLAVTFDSYADVNGNVQTTPFEWEVVVAGDADYYPVADEIILYYVGSSSTDSKIGSETRMLNRYDVKTGGEFWVWDGYYDEMSDEFEWEDYDRYRLTASAVQFLGFFEVDDKRAQEKDIEITFSPAVDWLKLPVGDVTTWSGESTFSPAPPSGKPDRVSYTITVAPAAEDLESPTFFHKDGGGPPVFWLDCRRVELAYTLLDGTTEISSGTDTYWYAPGVGPVRQMTVESEGSSTYTEDLYLMFMGYEDELLEGDS